MKKTILPAAILLMTITNVFSQDSLQRKPVKFHHFYIALGSNLAAGTFGSSPDMTMSAKSNVLSGRYGTQPGYLFELGTRFYFSKKNPRLRYGLDYTIFSATYNSMDWNAFADADGGELNTNPDPKVFSVSTKLGPVFCYNVTSKLIVDVRLQVAPTMQVAFLDYSKSGGSTYNDEITVTTDKILENFGVKFNPGIGVRWGVIGIAADYSLGKINTPYEYTDGTTGNTTNDKVKIQSNTLQVKLTFNL